MKKIYLLAVALAGTLLTSCSDFLDKVPLVVPSSETFLTNQSAVTNYVNGLYIALPSAGAYGMGIMGEEKNSDNMVAMVYDRRMHKVFMTVSKRSTSNSMERSIRRIR